MSETIEIPAGLARQLAKALAAHGRGGDTMLAHINPKEARMLKRSGGRGKPNPKTGLLEFDGGGDAFNPGDPQQAASVQDTSYGQAYAAQPADPLANYALPGDVWKTIQSQTGYNPSKAYEASKYLAQDFNPTGDPNYQYTPQQIAGVTGWTDAHSRQGEGLLSAIGRSVDSFQAALPILGIAGLATGLGAVGFLGDLGVGAADAAVAADAGLTAGGLTDLTGALAAAGSPALTSAASVPAVASLGDAGFTAGLAASDPAFAASFGSLGGAAGGAAGATSGVTGLAAPQSGASAPALAAPQGTPLVDLTSQVQAASPDAFGPGAASSLQTPLGIQPSSSFVSQATDVTPGAASGFADATTTGQVILPDGTIGNIPGEALQGPTLSGAPLGGSNSGGGWLSSLLGSNGAAGGGVGGSGISAGDLIKGLGVATSVGGLAKNLTTPNSIPGQSNLTNLASQLGASGAALTGNTAAVQQQANTLSNQGNQLSSYLTSGTLPPGVQTAIDNASADAIAAIKGNYASKGLTGSTMETQDINAVKSRATAEGASIAQNLLSSGLTAEQAAAQISQSLVSTGTAQTGLSAQIYQQLLGLNVNQNAATSQAIANLAAALAGGGQYVGTNRSNALTVNG